jgi:NAD-dependent DNA ligase
LELFAEKRAENLIDAIQKSKKQTLDRFIFGLGIPNIGEKAAYVLAEAFGSIDAVMKASEDDIMRLHDTGPVAAAPMSLAISSDVIARRSCRRSLSGFAGGAKWANRSSRVRPSRHNHLENALACLT